MARSSTITVRILGDTKGLSKALRESEGKVGGFKSVGSKIGGAVMGAAKNAIKVAGGGATLVAGLAITKGMQRLIGIENATAKLRGLGHDAKTVDTIMANALASVKGTSYGMEEAATTAASAVAAGIKPGQELTKYLTLTADAATIAGTSMDEMGAIINKVTTAGKAQADNLNQLADRGIPIFQWLAKEYGVSAEELSKMVRRGEVDSETFRKVIEDNIGGAALESGNTTQGAFKNMMASLGRIGANFLTGVFPKFKGAFQGIIGFLGPLEDRAKGAGKALGDMVNKVIPVLKRVGAMATQAFNILFKGKYTDGPLAPNSSFVKGLRTVRDLMGRLASFVTGTVIPAFKKIADFVSRNVEPVLAGLAVVLGAGVLAGALSAITALVSGLAAAMAFLMSPVVLVVGGLALLAAGIVYAYQNFEWFRDIVDVVITFIQEKVIGGLGAVVAWVKEIWPQISEAISHVMNVIKGIIRTVIDVVSALWRAWGDDLMRMVKTAWDFISETVENAINLVKSIIETVLAIINGDWGKAWDGIKGIAAAVWDQIHNLISTAINLVKSVIGGVLSTIKEVWNGAWNTVSSKVSDIWTSIKETVSGGIDAVVGFVKALPGEIADIASGAFDSIKDAFKSALNWIIDGWNSLEFKIPGFDPPGPGPKFGGFTLGVPKIPRLAKGGIVTGPTLAYLAEAGHQEAVIPLNAHGIGVLRDALRSAIKGAGDDTSARHQQALLDELAALRRDIQALPREYKINERVA